MIKRLFHSNGIRVSEENFATSGLLKWIFQVHSAIENLLMYIYHLIECVN